MQKLIEDFEINISYNKEEQLLTLNSYKSGHGKIIVCSNKEEFEKILTDFLSYTIPYEDKEEEFEIDK